MASLQTERATWLKLLFIREKAEKLCIDLINHFLKVFRTVLELYAVHVKNKQLMLIILDPVFITLVQTGDIVYTDALLVLAASLLDLADEVRNRASEVNQKAFQMDRAV